jgi:hypothetical protein
MSGVLNSRIAACVALLVSLPCGAAPACHRATFSGEVSGQQTFRRVLGMGLSFRMEPLDDHWGWIYEIGPTDPALEELDTYIHAMNPPFRGRNITNLSIEYATPAQDAVAKIPLEFWFIASRAEGEVAGRALDDILWPRTDDAPELALKRLGALKAGKGTLRVTDADFRPGISPEGSVAPGADFGQIDRIAFTVSLTVPGDFRFLPDLKPEEAACPDMREWRKQWEP